MGTKIHREKENSIMSMKERNNKVTEVMTAVTEEQKIDNLCRKE